jgi:hypothetical protein
MKNRHVALLFLQYSFPLLMVTCASLLDKQQCFSQVTGTKYTKTFLPRLKEQPAPSPSEVVKEYWKASSSGKFADARKYVDTCSLDPKYSIDRDMIKSIARLTPQLINNNYMVKDQKPGELTIGKIEEESLRGDTAIVIVIVHFRGSPVTRSKFRLERCKSDWKIKDVTFFYKDVSDLSRKKEG